MNHRVMTALAVASICIGVAAARPQGIGLGLMAGEPSGFSAKVWTGPHVALDAGLGYSYYSYWWPNQGQALQVHGDVLWHTNSLTQSSADGYLPLYIGLGARVRLANVGHETNYPLRVGLRIPFGLEYVFASVPIGLFVELVPILDLTPDARGFGGNSAIGFRYYFSGSSED
ncbi:MAG: hypothetical protein WCK89_24450 [bacterium]